MGSKFPFTPLAITYAKYLLPWVNKLADCEGDSYKCLEIEMMKNSKHESISVGSLFKSTLVRFICSVC